VRASKGSLCWGLVVAALLWLALGAAPVMAAGSSAARPKGAGPGCDPARPAVASYAGGVVLSPQPARAPIPCATVVGTTSEAADVGFLGPGSVFYAPLLLNTSTPPQNTLQGPEQVAKSQDGGATWTGLSSGGPTTGGLVPPWMSIDRRTRRIWFATAIASGVDVPSACGARISWSDDGGRRWQTNPFVGCPAEGAEKVLEGPAPAGAAHPRGYPHVVYYCANYADGLSLPLYCYKSLDGGRTFSSTGGFPDPTPPSSCTDYRHRARAGIVGPDGALYFPTNLCGSLGVTVSRDEGATWQNMPTGITGVTDSMYVASLASDFAGNLYLAYLGQNGLPQLTISRNHGRSWSTPITAVAPGLTKAMRVAITAGRPGEIALAYLGTSDGQNYNGYITEGLNALRSKPVFWSASVNDPAEPLVYGSNPTTFGDRLLYATDVLTPHGEAWAGFHCAQTTACPGRRVGVVGRLTW
jgi:hypothetical protein